MVGGHHADPRQPPECLAGAEWEQDPQMGVGASLSWLRATLNLLIRAEGGGDRQSCSWTSQSGQSTPGAFLDAQTSGSDPLAGGDPEKDPVQHEV